MSDIYYIRSVERRVDRLENEAYDARWRGVQVLFLCLMGAGTGVSLCGLAWLFSGVMR
jgi:hypothetical protein